MLFLLSLALALPVAAWRGFVLQKLWLWFLVPLGLTPVSLWEAAGLSLVVSFLTYQHSYDEDSDRAKEFVHAIVMAVITPLIALAFGAVYHALGA